MSDAPAIKDAKGIFLAALDIPEPAERAAFVRQSCGTDEALLKRVDDLLRAYGESGGPLDKLAAALAPTHVAEPIREQVGSTIGPYKLMEQIGEGGFGLVFVAEQQQPIRRKVALKIIKPGMDSRDVIARFEAERQALALMDHPNIAKVLDAGTTESGRPYFVMELVRGVPITDYCDQNQLTPRERLELFVPVCNAIQHAHLKGIIHRDVKPSNVLVTMHDAKPVVKVIDFGVAKALYQPLTDRTIYTRFAQMIGTPLYMSPEQAQMSGLDIDTRSDIYSLGVLLYELLTGSTPFNKDRLAKAAYDELLKIIREEEPPKPSVRLSQSTDSLPSIAAQRKTEPAKLSRIFSGDLDWITMKALEKDRTRRYETANAFAADVLRYLNYEPVEASPPSAVYRIRKFTRKHRRTVIALAAIAAGLLFGIAGTTWGLVRAKEAVQAAKVAQQAATRSERKAIDALEQVTSERNAKEQALKQKEFALKEEAAQHDRAERELAIGILRQIGLSDYPTDPGELRSFVDWSAIREPRLQMRVLEVAFESPEAAMRIARRAERVAHSCVGLSPKRRDYALKLLSLKQRDPAADPRVRAAACWLAQELGSADLPAWGETCTYLFDERNQHWSNCFNEFIQSAARRSDHEQFMRLNIEPLLAIADSSSAQSVNAWQALEPVVSAFSSSQLAREWASITSELANPRNTMTAMSATTGFAALAPRLNASQFQSGWNLVIRALMRRERNVNGPVITFGLACSEQLQDMVPRLQPAQVGQLLDALLEDFPADPVCNQLERLAPHLDEVQAKHAFESLIVRATLRDPRKILAAIAVRLDRETVRDLADTLLASLDKSTVASAEGLAGLASRLNASQVGRAASGLVMALQKGGKGTEGSAVRTATINGIISLAPRLNSQSLDVALSAILENGQADDLGRGIAALAPSLSEQEIESAMTRLMVSLQNKKDVSSGFAALAARLNSKRASRAWDAIVAAWESKAIPYMQWGRPVYPPREVLAAVASRMGSEHALDEASALIGILQASDDRSFDRRSVAIDGLAALAPHLDATRANEAWNNLLKIKNKGPDDPVWAALRALAPKLDPALRSEQSLGVTKDVLDRCASNFPYRQAEDGWEPSEISTTMALVNSISSARHLATILSHPACVGDQGACLLKRFEELVLFDGNHVFAKVGANENAVMKKRKEPSRRFRTLYDASAWIQQNWPDFDLETNCSATWRRSG